MNEIKWVSMAESLPPENTIIVAYSPAYAEGVSETPDAKMEYRLMESNILRELWNSFVEVSHWALLTPPDLQLEERY